MGFLQSLASRLGGMLRFRQPWFVPVVQPIELFFFQRVFMQLCKKDDSAAMDEEDEDKELMEWSDMKVEEEQEVPLVVFQRAMVRLFRVIKDDRKFDCAEYDTNMNGKVGWFEFCSLWKERGIHVRLTFAERIFLTLEDAERSIMGKIWSGLIFVAIVVSVGSFILSTMPEMQQSCPPHGTPAFDETCEPEPKAFFNTIDLICVVLFTVEYFVRLMLSAFMRTELVDSDKTLLLKWMVSDDVIRIPTRLSRLRVWALNLSNIIDLAAVIPWYLTVVSAALNGGGQNQGFVLKILRLARVVRAFRLGRRFEAVIIIVRSVRRSIRALYVLVLNLFLGMIIFGALMYFAEQGDWDPFTRAHLRWEDPQTQNRSPFDSIPACFWWVIVTATTVGYGDDYTPTTPPGKLVAGLTMVWSLCVLALPIGVIGGNFSQVWDEYDNMKEKEEQMRLREETMLKRSIAWGDPLYYSRKLLLELWHDSGLLSGEYAESIQSEFLGEVDYTMDLPKGEPVRRRCKEPLTANNEKARRKVCGTLTFEYNWQPLTHTSPDMLMLGRLEVTVVKAENLLNIDWKGGGVSDPYCIVNAFPNSPNEEDGLIVPTKERTKTVYDSTAPVWDETVCFDVCWTQEGTDGALLADMRQISREISKSWATLPKPSAGNPNLRRRFSNGNIRTSVGSQKRESIGPVTKAQSEAEVLSVVPELQGEVDRLKQAVPQLQQEIGEVQKDLQLILNAVRSRRQFAQGGPMDVHKACVSSDPVTPPVSPVSPQGAQGGTGDSNSIT